MQMILRLLSAIRRAKFRVVSGTIFGLTWYDMMDFPMGGGGVV